MAEATATVSKNLALADLDELLRTLLTDELTAVQMTGVEITFDAPTRERSSAWRLPAVNLFLYDLREAASPRDRGWHPHSNGGGPTLERSPLRLACTFSITAWTRDVVDEHQLLSQVLSILLAYPVLAGDMLPASLQVGSPAHGLSTRVAQAKEEGRADFWSAIGSPYKVSLEYMVTILCVAGQTLARGRPVTSAGVSDGPLYTQRGTVRDATGRGVPDVWLVLPHAGPWTTSGPDGSFALAGVVAGEHELLARSANGHEARGTMTVPGPPAELRFERAV